MMMTRVTIILTMLFISINFIACNKYTRYKTLSFLFDDVPPPIDKRISQKDSIATDSLVFANIDQPVLKRTTQTIIRHKVFTKTKCKECHSSTYSNQLKEDPPQLCYQCHENFKEDFDFLHGPVASGYCTVCHNPHKSKNEKLLNFPIDKLCVYCHDIADVLKNDTHEDITPAECLDCHDPHGGDDKFLM